MADEVRGGSSFGAGDSGQAGVTPADLGEQDARVSEDDVEIVDPDEVAAPPVADSDSSPVVNADLVDDPEEMKRTIERASGEQVDVVSESEETDENP